MNQALLKQRQIVGMPAFTLVWIGQIVSMLATQMTQFTITVWAYEKTGSVTALGLVTVFGSVSFLLMSPIAGAMVDRYNRKLMMMISDLGAGTATLLLLTLQSTNGLQMWHLYLASAITGLFSAFQWPAYSSSISLMVPKKHLGRANGLMSLLDNGPAVLAPLLAGALLPFTHFAGILTIDVVTFVIAILVLLIVVVPQPSQVAAGDKGSGNLLRESVYGFRYIFARPSLFGLQLLAMVANIFGGIYFVLLPAMILARTSNNELVLASIQSIGATGAILGGIALAVWGGFKRRVHGVLLGYIVAGLLGCIVMSLRFGLPAWLIASFISTFAIPIIGGSTQAIWQSKVAPNVQGRVFSARRLIGWSSQPITPILGGLLADRWLEPAIRANGSLAQFWAPIVGTGPGAGMALIMIFMGLGTALIGVAGYLVRGIRDVETILPDHI